MRYIPKQLEESVFALAEVSIFESEKTAPTSSSGLVFSDSNLRPSALANSRFFKLFGYMSIGIIRLYQLCVSPLLGPCCRFWPSCSEYAIQALKKHPFHRALWLIIKRLCRCAGWHPGGIDPVP